MDLKNKSNIIYLSKIIIPIIIVFILFIGGVSTGVITFETPNKQINTGEIKATIKIDFGDGKVYQKALNIHNSTVFNFLLEVNTIGDISVESSYSEQMGGYEIKSITYQEKKYVHGDGGHWWLFYINGQFASAGADKIYVNNNDLIEWKYEKF